MKILQLELEGFGPFRRPQVVDFTKFDEEGIFLIGGKTGAGKSSLLDAIVFALYGQVPRYDRSADGVRSNFSLPTEGTTVTLEFEHGGERYRVSRSPEYAAAKLRGEGMTIRPAKQQLERLDRDTWIALATRANDVGSELKQIFPLTATQFLQVVMLAQNQFQKFLHAGSSERQKLLSTLFHTQRYGRIAELLSERSRDSGAQLAEAEAKREELNDRLHRQLNKLAPASITTVEHGELTTTVEQSEVTTTDEHSELTRATLERATELADATLAECEQVRSRAAKNQLEATQQLREAERVHQLQHRRAEAESTRQKLLADAERIDTDVKRALDTDAAAAPLMPLLTAAEREHRQFVDADTHFKTAVDSLNHELTGKDARDVPAALRAADATALTLDSVAPDAAELGLVTHGQRELTELAGALAEGATIDERVAALKRRHDEAAADVKEHAEKIVAIRTEIEKRPAQKAEIVDSLATVKERSQGLEGLEQALTEAAERLAAAQRLPGEQRAAVTAAQRFASASQDLTECQERERQLVSARWLGAAAHLAADLVDGEACAVCGSTDHPAPAESSEQHVTDDMLEQAIESVRVATRQAENARSSLIDAESVVKVTEAQTLGRSLDVALAEHDVAEKAVTRGREARTEIAVLEQQLAALTTADDNDKRVLDVTTQAHEKARQHAESNKTRHAELVARRDELRGDFESVHARLERLRTLESACGSYVSAAENRDRANEARARANAELDSALASSNFDDASAIRAARLNDNQRESLTNELNNYRDRLKAAENILAEPALEGIARDPIDLETPKEREARAQAALESANTTLGSTSTLRDELMGTVNDASATLDLLAGLGERARAERQLASDLGGQNERLMNLEAFVLAAHLEEIIAAANSRLAEITSHRYELELDDDLAGHRRQSGLGLAIFDVYNGKSRNPTSLSGGETFLVALALALGLADVVSAQAGGITLDTLFIDEGFGSLDSETLETAMRTLDRLREGGRTVGVISHVGSMQERIPARLDVTVSEDGSSEVHHAETLVAAY